MRASEASASDARSALLRDVVLRAASLAAFDSPSAGASPALVSAARTGAPLDEPSASTRTGFFRGRPGRRFGFSSAGASEADRAAALAALAGAGVEADSAASETTGVLRGRPGPRFGLASAGASAASVFTFRGRPGPRFTGEAEVVLSAVFFGASEASAALVSATSLSLIIYACCTFSQSLRKESRPRSVRGCCTIFFRTPKGTVAMSAPIRAACVT